jgi:hypothetical protein
VQNSAEVQTTRSFTVEGKTQTISQTFTLDGSEDTNPASSGHGLFVSRSTWKKNRLVNSGTQTSDTSRRDYEVQVREEYSLGKHGKTLTIKTLEVTPRGEMSFKQVFDRQSPLELARQ